MQRFRSGLSALVELAKADFDDLWSGIDRTDPVAVRAFLERVMPDLVDTYGASAALIAADYYDEVTSGFGANVAAVLDDSIGAGQVAGSTRWALGPLFAEEPDAEAAAALMRQVIDRLVKQSARNTIHNASKRDGVGYARVPSGSETCAFCLMLASRGPVYGTAKDAGGEGNRFHGDCDCVPTPMRDHRDYPDGYDPDELYDVYLEARAKPLPLKEKTARDAANDNDAHTKQILATMRVNLGIDS